MQYVAVLGGMTSGVTTREKAIEWATKQLASDVRHHSVTVCQVVAVVERTIPPITVRDIIVAEQLAEAA